jgi:hypothetical protein
VENVSDDSSYFFREAIVVPAVEDLVDIEDRGGPIGIPEPRPMPVEPGGTGDGAGPPPKLDSEEAGQAEPGSAGESGIGIQIEE